MKKYIGAFVVFLILGLVGKSIYDETNKEKVPGKTTRLECHKKVTTFERGYGLEDIQKAQESFKLGSYTLKANSDKAVYMKSTLFDFVSLEHLSHSFETYIKEKYQGSNLENQPFTIEYTVYENDVEDPKKKSDNCKLFRGYVVLKFINENNKVVYQIQIDFLDQEGKDIPQTLECGLESFLTYK